jgi:hypothetical protein
MAIRREENAEDNATQAAQEWMKDTSIDLFERSK